MAIIKNSATLTYNNAQTVNSNEVDTEVRESQSVAIAKDALLTNYVPGEPVGYVMTVTNTGTGNLTGITVSDNLGSDTAAKLLDYIDGTAVARLGQRQLHRQLQEQIILSVFQALAHLRQGSRLQ